LYHLVLSLSHSFCDKFKAFAVAAVATKSIGYGPPLAWCFVHFNGFGFGTGLSRDYPLFYIPDGVLFVVILALFFATIGMITRIRANRVEVTSGFDIFLRTQVRVLIFIFVILAIFFTIFEWRFAVQSTTDKEHLDSVGLNWAYCKMKTALNKTDPGYCPGDHNPARVDYGHTVFESFLLSGIGMLIFIAFGSDHLIFSQWAIMFRLVFHGEWEKLRDLIISGKDPYKKQYETAPRGTKTSTEGVKASSGSRSAGKSGNSNSNSDSASAGPVPPFAQSEDSPYMSEDTEKGKEIGIEMSSDVI